MTTPTRVRVPLDEAHGAPPVTWPVLVDEPLAPMPERGRHRPAAGRVSARELLGAPHRPVLRPALVAALLTIGLLALVLMAGCVPEQDEPRVEISTESPDPTRPPGEDR
jgi:hypothetical protein